MYVVRNIFHCKPGKAKDLVAVFKKVHPILVESGVAKSTRILTDASASFWTVVGEADVQDIGKYFDALANLGTNAAVKDAMKGYMDMVEGGSREIWKVE